MYILGAEDFGLMDLRIGSMAASASQKKKYIVM
jgi:hypothetical protein